MNFTQPVIDIHVFDGMLDKTIRDSPKTPIEKSIIISNMIVLIITRIQEPLRQFGVKVLSIIKNDINSPANYLQSDNIRAEDVVVGIYERIVKEKDIEVVDTVLNEICNQSMDLVMTNGYCPSGRVTRLIQIYNFLK